MDKRANIILFGCILCSILIALLFLIVVSISHKSCELIHLDQKEHRESILLSFHNDNTPKRTRDKKTLVKMVAHLEYDLEPSKEDSELEPKALPAQSVQNSSSTTTAKPIAVVPIKLHGDATSLASARLQNVTNWTSKPRFMPMELVDVDMESTENKFQFRYKLNFNCSQIIMLVNRGPDEVSVERMWVELKLHNKKRSKCEVDFKGPKNLMNIDLRRASDKLARFYCDRELRFDCHHYNESHQSRPGLLLGQLVINGIEFETGNATDAVSHKSREFQGSARAFCH